MALSIRALARAMMSRFVRLGLSATRVTNELVRMYGRAYRRTLLLADLREFKGVLLHQEPLQRLRMTTPIPRNLLTEALLRRPRRYLVAGIGEFREEATGDIVKRHISWYTQTSGSKQDLFDEYKDAQLVESSDPGQTLLKIDFLSIRHHRDMEY